MNNVITQLLVVALAIVPFVNAVVGLIKKSFINLKSNFYPIISVVVGIVLGALFAFLPDVHYSLSQMIIAGVIAGMASCGVYEISKSPDAINTDSPVTSLPVPGTSPDVPVPAVPVVSAASPVTPLSGAAAQANAVEPNVSK